MDMWEILVPTEMIRDGKTKPIRVRYHKVWDEKVKAIAGGLTILKPAMGYWVSDEGETFRERMIPVRIICSMLDITKIAEMTMEYYNQEAVLYYKISTEAHILKRS